MTADWRATLERVAEKLEASMGLGREDNQQIDDALALLRGLLAAPQPDGSQAIEALGWAMKWVPTPRTPHNLYASNYAAAMKVLDGLAEPQVNPSEAKDLEAFALSILRRRDQWPEGHVAWRVLEGILNTELAGLLAEGEESREPARRVGRDRLTWMPEVACDAY